jgi:hypothetical protein
VNIFAQRVRQGQLFKRLCIMPSVPELHPPPARAQPQRPTLEASAKAAAVHRVISALHHELEKSVVAGCNAQHAAECLRNLRNERRCVWQGRSRKVGIGKQVDRAARAGCVLTVHEQRVGATARDHLRSSQLLRQRPRNHLRDDADVADGQQVQRCVRCLRYYGSDVRVQSGDAAGSGRDQHHVRSLRNAAQQHAALKKREHFFSLGSAERLPRRHKVQQTQIQLITQVQVAKALAGYVVMSHASVIHKETTVLSGGQHLHGLVVHERPKQIDHRLVVSKNY